MSNEDAGNRSTGRAVPWREPGKELLPTNRERKAILKRRAEKLARRTDDDESREKHLQLLLFEIAGEKYGLEPEYIREVYTVKEITPVPCTPPFVSGIISVRGKITSVIDLKKIFGIFTAEQPEFQCVIIIADELMEFGIVADNIDGMHSFSRDEIQPVPSAVSGAGSEYLIGITSDRTAILDASAILKDESILIFEKVKG